MVNYIFESKIQHAYSYSYYYSPKFVNNNRVCYTCAGSDTISLHRDNQNLSVHKSSNHAVKQVKYQNVLVYFVVRSIYSSERYKQNHYNVLQQPVLQVPRIKEIKYGLCDAYNTKLRIILFQSQIVTVYYTYYTQNEYHITYFV